MLEWLPSWSTGVEEIDNQHKKILVIINDILAEINSGEDQISLNSLLEKLANYAREHFETEETYLDTMGYELFHSHQDQHNTYLDVVSDFWLSGKYRDEKYREELVEFIQNWWKTHILVEDLIWARNLGTI